MQAIILCAGRGTRMGILTDFLPKPLLKFGKYTLLEHKLLNLPVEINEVIIVIGYLGEKIIRHIGPYYANKKIIYVTQNNLYGTGHALLQAKDILSGNFLVLMGDDIYDKDDLERLVATKPITLLFSIEDIYTGACILSKSFFEMKLQSVPDNPNEFGIPQTLEVSNQTKFIKKIYTDRWKKISCQDDLL